MPGCWEGPVSLLGCDLARRTDWGRTTRTSPTSPRSVRLNTESIIWLTSRFFRFLDSTNNQRLRNFLLHLGVTPWNLSTNVHPSTFLPDRWNPRQIDIHDGFDYSAFLPKFENYREDLNIFAKLSVGVTQRRDILYIFSDLFMAGWQQRNVGQKSARENWRWWHAGTLDGQFKFLTRKQQQGHTSVGCETLVSPNALNDK